MGLFPAVFWKNFLPAHSSRSRHIFTPHGNRMVFNLFMQVHDTRQFTRHHKAMQVSDLWGIANLGNARSVLVPEDLIFSQNKPVFNVVPVMGSAAKNKRLFNPSDYLIRRQSLRYGFYHHSPPFAAFLCQTP